MRKLDTISQYTEVACPECGVMMKQYGVGGGLWNRAGDVAFVCKNEKCKFIGVPRMVTHLLSDEFLGVEL